MTIDLLFNPILRDLPNGGGDAAIVETASQLSTQNGTILLEARVMNILKPVAGIGFNNQIIGGNVAGAAFQLNRWSAQCIQDGALLATWNRVVSPENISFDFASQVNYNLPQ